jgi:hypothetical protein
LKVNCAATVPLLPLSANAAAIALLACAARLAPVVEP